MPEIQKDAGVDLWKKDHRRQTTRVCVKQNWWADNFGTQAFGWYLLKDLVPKSNAQAWLKYLRHTAPTLPFLSSSANQHQRANISSTTAPGLMKLLKAYKPKIGTVTVGVVGYPNVGKSSLINSLRRSKVWHISLSRGFLTAVVGLCSSCTSWPHERRADCPSWTGFTDSRYPWRRLWWWRHW